MIILGIETSCDETAAAVILTQGNQIKILSSVVASQIKLHAKTLGVVPEVAARAHIEKIVPVIDAALKAACMKKNQIEVIAVTAGPGLMTSLMVGVDTARSLAIALGIPLVAVNHVEAHAYSALIQNSKFEIRNSKQIFTALALVVSGGHSDLILIKDWLKQKKIGQTVDDAAGECFDKVAKILNLGYPGGPILSKLALRGRPIIPFPRPMINSKDFNFSFSGLKTAVLYYVRDHPVGNGRDRSLHIADIAASAQASIVDVLVAKTIAAAKKYRVHSILLGGGVAANQALRAKLKVESKKSKVRLLIAEHKYCTDNAVMIAFAGYLHARKKEFNDAASLRADSNWELR